MVTAVVQPIAGVSASRETEIEAIYPTLAGGILGGFMGLILSPISAISVGLIRIPLLLIFGAVLVPIGLLAYALDKIFGHYYVLTNRSIYSKKYIGITTGPHLPLADIVSIAVERPDSYRFFNAGDVHLLDAQGNPLLTLQAVPYPERPAQIILDAREARTRSDSSLAAIQARG